MTNKQIFQAVANAIYISPFGNQYQVMFPFYDGKLNGPTGSSNSQSYSSARAHCRELRIYSAVLQLLKKQGKKPNDDLYYEIFTNPELEAGDWRHVALNLANTYPHTVEI